MTRIKFHSLLFIVLAGISVSPGHAQEKETKGPSSPKVYEGFSGQMFPAKRTSRGSSLNLDDIPAFAKGAISIFDFQKQYKRIFLGSDFFDEASQLNSCDSLKLKIGKIKSRFVPVSDRIFFRQSNFKKIEELEGYYKFKNSKNLPGLLPNVDIWIKMETYRKGKSTENNCLVIKFLIPEDVKGQITESVYVLKIDGTLSALEPDSDLDFSKRPDFESFCIFPLNDARNTTHLVGKDFSVLGSFARQKQCEDLNGLLFPTTRKGASNGCVFFRRFTKDVAPKF